MAQLNPQEEKETVFREALENFKKGSPPKLKKKRAGRSLLVQSHYMPQLKNHQEASYLILNKHEGIYGTVKPTTPEEEKQTVEFLDSLHNKKKAPASHPIVRYVETLDSLPLYKGQVLGQSFFFQGKNKIFVRQFKKNLIVLEVDETKPSLPFYIGLFRL